MGNCETKNGLFKSKELLDQYNWSQIIGKGGFGKVWLVEDKQSKVQYAVKKLNKAK